MNKKFSIVFFITLFIVFGALPGCNREETLTSSEESTVSELSTQTQDESSVDSDSQTESESSESRSESDISNGNSDEPSPSDITPETTATPAPVTQSPSPKPTISPTQKPSSSPTPMPTITVKPSVKYYLAGSWNGYLVNDENYILQPLQGKSGFFYITVDLTPGNRDPLYDGHWYKVTEDNWNKSYGIEKYAVQPAPVKYIGDAPIGLGSIWIDANITLTVYFDSVTKTIYDTTMDASILP